MNQMNFRPSTIHTSRVYVPDSVEMKFAILRPISGLAVSWCPSCPTLNERP